jgi:hypothetical protein
MSNYQFTSAGFFLILLFDTEIEVMYPSEIPDFIWAAQNVNLRKTKSPWPESASELYRPSYRRLSSKFVPIFPDRERHVVSVTNPHGHIFVFLDWSRYFLFRVAPQLYSRGWVDPVPEPLLLRKSGSAGNRPLSSGSVAKNSDHKTTSRKICD